jgi:hypothetical protein
MFMDSATGFFWKGVSASSSFPTQSSGVKKVPPRILQRWVPQTYGILKLVVGYLGLHFFVSDSRQYSGSLS